MRIIIALAIMQRVLIYVIGPSLTILLALLGMYWPSLLKELDLQLQCHLNDTHLAQENGRLRKQIEQLRNEADAVGEKKKQYCLNEKYTKHGPGASRNVWLWQGVMMCVHADVATIALLLCCCCCCCFCCWCWMNWHQRGRNWVAIP